MGQRQTAGQIAEWAEQQVAPATHKKPVKRLTQLDVAWLIKANREGLTQTAIAERLGVSQSAVSRWIEHTTDSTDTAKSYLRGQALRMAKNIVQKGRAREHVQTLTGLGVLQEQANAGFTLVVNGFSLHGTGPGAGVGQTLDGEVLSPLAQLGSGETA